jgi:uncharacterized YccA/Bax inhibitor family protein
MLAGLAVVAGIASAALHVDGGFLAVAFIAAAIFGLLGIFRPARAGVFAPLYAVSMGAVLGWVSRYYANTTNGAVVPLAILGTTAIFFGVLIAYRTGLVKVTNRFVQVTLIASLGLLVMMIAVILGLKLPYTSQATTYFVIFGVLYLFIAVMNLFVDFNFVYKAQDAGVRKEGEWFAALSIMFSLVMVYLALLRIFGNSR